jgi:hypothetical protein
MTDTTKTYVFHDTEVKLTGRTADKELKTTRRTKPSAEPTVATLHEITPVDSMNGSWKKWVRMAELFEIK